MAAKVTASLVLQHLRRWCMEEGCTLGEGAWAVGGARGPPLDERGPYGRPMPQAKTIISGRARRRPKASGLPQGLWAIRDATRASPSNRGRCRTRRGRVATLGTWGAVARTCSLHGAAGLYRRWRMMAGGRGWGRLSEEGTSRGRADRCKYIANRTRRCPRVWCTRRGRGVQPASKRPGTVSCVQTWMDDAGPGVSSAADEELARRGRWCAETLPLRPPGTRGGEGLISKLY